MKKIQYQDAIIECKEGKTTYLHNIKKVICLKSKVIFVQKGNYWCQFYNDEIISWKAGTNLW